MNTSHRYSLSLAFSLSEQLQRVIHHAPKDAPELVCYTDALSHVQRALEALEKVPEPRYRLLEVGEVIQEGDEGGSGWLWWKTKSIGYTVQNPGTYRRPITRPTAQEFDEFTHSAPAQEALIKMGEGNPPHA